MHDNMKQTKPEPERCLSSNILLDNVEPYWTAGWGDILMFPHLHCLGCDGDHPPPARYLQPGAGQHQTHYHTRLPQYSHGYCEEYTKFGKSGKLPISNFWWKHLFLQCFHTLRINQWILNIKQAVSPWQLAHLSTRPSLTGRLVSMLWGWM